MPEVRHTRLHTVRVHLYLHQQKVVTWGWGGVNWERAKGNLLGDKCFLMMVAPQVCVRTLYSYSRCFTVWKRPQQSWLTVSTLQLSSSSDYYRPFLNYLVSQGFLGCWNLLRTRDMPSWGKKKFHTISKVVVFVNVQIKEIQRQQLKVSLSAVKQNSEQLHQKRNLQRHVSAQISPVPSSLVDKCLLISVDQFRGHLFCEAIPDPPCYVSHLLAYAPTLPGTCLFPRFVQCGIICLPHQAWDSLRLEGFFISFPRT